MKIKSSSVAACKPGEHREGVSSVGVFLFFRHLGASLPVTMEKLENQFKESF